MSADRAVFVGTWRWYKTSVREWFDVGPDQFHEYTTVTEGFDYYFTISTDGNYKGYIDGVLEYDFILNLVDYEIFTEAGSAMALKTNCSNNEITFGNLTPNPMSDTIHHREYPLNFYNESERRESITNYFVRE
ncbi:MAG: hypothetical protein ACI837_002594 [Crocinitomicaceae bacterium]|jgi:hypothetical protein